MNNVIIVIMFSWSQSDHTYCVALLLNLIAFGSLTILVTSFYFLFTFYIYVNKPLNVIIVIMSSWSQSDHT
jgi:hypothetical protein